MKVVLRSQSLSQAYSLDAALNAAGIAAMVQGEHSIAIVGGGVTVVVLDDQDFAKAHSIMTELLAAPNHE